MTALAPSGVAISKIPLALSAPTRHFKIYLAADKVPGWNEVDAVALVSDNGVKQWAQQVEASSTYASTSGSGTGGVNPAVLIPAWSTLDRPPAGFDAAAKIRHERLADARGWPMLALFSENDLTTPATAAPAGSTNIFLVSPGGGFTGALAITTPATPGVRPAFPTHPIWVGIAGDTVFFAVVWLALWAGLTIPRRFVRELARLRRGACVQCGYDLGFDFPRGCPECGWRRTGKPGDASR
jgi:hypothetical protein